MTLPKTIPGAWKVVGLLWLVALLNYLDRLMMTTMHDPIVASIPMSEKDFGLLTSVFLWIYGCLSPFGGLLADRFNRRSVILTSLFVWSAVTWATSCAQTYPQLLTARALMGISEACYMPAALALIADYHRGPTRSLATGLHMSGIYMGAALGGIGGYIAQWYGWRSSFFVFGILGVVYAVVLLFSLRDAPKAASAVAQEDEGKNGSPTNHPGSSVASPHHEMSPKLDVPVMLKEFFTTGSFWILLGANMMIGMANWSVNGWLPKYLQDHFKLNLGEAGMSATAYIQVASFAAVLAGGFWADRWSRKNVRARALVPAIGYCVAGPFLLLSANTNVFAVAILGLIVFGIGRGFFDTNHMPILRQMLPERYSATAFGIQNCISCVAGGVMVIIAGAMKDAHIGLEKVFQFAAVGLFIVGLMLFALKLKPVPAATTSESKT